MRSTYILLMTLYCSSCSGGRLTGYIDQLSFSNWGTTIFSDPKQVSIKEIHLDTGGLLGRKIIIEGDLIDVGKYYTHIVVSDQSARMLVVLTKMRSPDEKIGPVPPKVLKVFGTIERGKKGLPYVSAIAINKAAKQKRS